MSIYFVLGLFAAAFIVGLLSARSGRQKKAVELNPDPALQSSKDLEPPIIATPPPEPRPSFKIPEPVYAILTGDGAFALEVEGSIEHQALLKEIVNTLGGRSERSFMVYVAHEPRNEKDQNACFVSSNGQRLGYLPLHISKQLVRERFSKGDLHGFAVHCKAMIRNIGGYYSLFLDYVPEGQEPRKPPESPGEVLTGDGSYSFEVVGESFYQSELRSIAGPENQTGKQYSCIATIRHEPHNRYDKNACAISIMGKKVGHLPKETAKKFVEQRFKNGDQPGFALTCNALIVGGWISKNGSNGHYGVRLDYVPNHLPATPIQKELLRFFGQKVPKGLTRKEAERLREEARKSDPEKYDQWLAYESLILYMQSSDGMDDHGIKKPSIKAIRDTFNKMLANGTDYKRIESELIDEFVDLMLDNNPGLLSL